MKFLFFTLFLFASLTLAAQYEKGNWYLSADTGAGGRSNVPSAGDLLGSSATGGFFLTNNLMFGARLEAGSFSYDNLTDTDYRVEPFVRYYLPSKQLRRLRYFAEVGGGLLFEPDLETYVKAGIGAEYRLTGGIMATAGLRYNTTSSKRPSSLTLDFGVNLILSDLKNGQASNFGNRKGTFTLDANVGELTFVKIGDLNLVSGAISLSGGYFLTNNLLLEGGASFAAYNLERTLGADTRDRRNRVSTNLGLRYLFNEGRRFQPYVSAGLRYDYVNQFYEFEGSGRVTDYKSSSLSGDLKAGFLYNFNNRVALDVNLGYNPHLSGTNEGYRVSGGVGLKVFLGK